MTMKPFVLAAALTVAISTAALSHSWYPASCCSGRDCQPLPIDHVVETRDGWHIKTCSPTRPICIDGFVARGKEKVSQDGGYHVCFNASRIICLFVPVNT